MRARLPTARLEVKGAAARVERAAANARAHARVATRVAIALAQLVTVVAGFGLFCALVVSLGDGRHDDRHLERDLARMRQLQDSLRLYDRQLQDAQLRAMIEAARWEPPALVIVPALPGADDARTPAR